MSAQIQIEVTSRSPTPMLNDELNINPTLTQVRFLLEEARKEWNYTCNRSCFVFKWDVAFWESIYNLFHFLAFPILIYREGTIGLIPRQFWGFKYGGFALVSGIIWLLVFSANVIYILSLPEMRNLFFFPLMTMDILFIVRSIIVGTKYGYLPTYVLDFFSKSPLPKKEVLDSIHLLSGWGVGHPRALAEAMWLTEKYLNLRLSDIRLTFRSKEDFNLKDSDNCSCSIYNTTGDWLIPYLLIESNYNLEIFQKKLPTFSSIFSVAITMAPLIGRYERVPNGFSNTCYILLIVSITIPSVFSLFTAIAWAVTLALDFGRRLDRSRFCTHLLNPLRESFIDNMSKTYKDNVFAATKKISKRRLKKLDLQTIDFFNSFTLFNWYRFRLFLQHVGYLFYKREEIYNSILILAVILLQLLLLYCIVTSYIIIKLDLLYIILVVLSIFMPVYIALSNADYINEETSKQKLILVDRIAEMQYEELQAKDRNLSEWYHELINAKNMAQHCYNVLQQDTHNINIFQIRVDNNVVRVIGTLLGCLGYLLYAGYNTI